MNVRKVLIVDDDRVWLRVLGDFFRAVGYEVATAVNCAEGLALAARHRPCCVLLDFHLPDADAAAFCARIRADQDLGRTPIIVVSADAGEELNSYAEHKADGFVLKGGRLEKIRLMLESLLRRIDWERGVLEKGDLRLDAESLSVFRDAKPVVRLSPEQFRFLFILVERSPAFVSEEEILKFIFRSDTAPEKYEALRGVASRLRGKLGKRLGRRIKSSALSGWVYLDPSSDASGPGPKPPETACRPR